MANHVISSPDNPFAEDFVPVPGASEMVHKGVLFWRTPDFLEWNAPRTVVVFDSFEVTAPGDITIYPGYMDRITLATSMTLGVPQVDQDRPLETVFSEIYRMVLTQDAVGGHSLTLDAGIFTPGGTQPVIAAAPGAVTYLEFHSIAPGGWALVSVQTLAPIV